MGKANKVKGELTDAVDMVDLIQTMKDIADNKYFTLVGQKDRFKRFGETFVEFFRMISFTKEESPLIKNENNKVGIVVVTAEGSFLGEFNNRIIRLALEQKKKYDDAHFIGVGEKCIDRLTPHTNNLKAFTGLETHGLYETAVQIKEYLFDEIFNNRLGHVVVCYSFPKSFDTQKPRYVKLLPCIDLVSKQEEFVDEFENIIEESGPKEIIKFLSNLWVTTRLYEIIMDTIIAGASAQSQFLDDSLDKMDKEKKKTLMRYRKAKKGDIDKSLRETFSARMMSLK